MTDSDMTDTAGIPAGRPAADAVKSSGPVAERDRTAAPGRSAFRGRTKDEGTGERERPESDRRTRVTVLVALAANIVIAAAKAAGGLLSGSPALLSEAAHSVADSVNEIFLLAALRRSRRPPDSRHPFGYGKERYFWSLLAAVGIFVVGGCFSVFQGVEALSRNEQESPDGYTAGLIVLGVAFLAEGGSLLRALLQLRGEKDGARDPALRTVIAEDGTAVLGVALAMAGMVLHLVTGNVVWEASASLAIGLLLVHVAFRLGRDARDRLIGESADAGLRRSMQKFLTAQAEIDNVAALFTMGLGLDSVLVAARIDLAPGIDSEEIERVSVRIKQSMARTWPEAEHIFLDITNAPPRGGV
ncbi:cation diffusion facilitator family transporter [Streptomyces sp. NPDC020403]|uniref:cation diffusion facilitator family transporter n=1 Tax=unclassified Streptomyces TaxID=2593676 RepID=UPI0033D2B505